jgi:hypothetical protein
VGGFDTGGTISEALPSFDILCSFFTLKVMARKNGKMDLEKLARMVEHGFSEIATNFTLVEERFNIVDKRFDSLAEILRLMQDDNKRFKETSQVEILELWEHVRRLERKVGLRK